MSEVALLRNGIGVCDGPIVQGPYGTYPRRGDKNPTLHLHVMSLGACYEAGS